MLFRCKLWNSYGSQGDWTDIELVGDDFKEAFAERFGSLKAYKVRDVGYLNPTTMKWEKLENWEW